MIFNIYSRKGQSLIEAMVALSVLTVGFLGIISLLSSSFFYGRDISDTMKATYLASEGIELTKNLIDHDVTLNAEGLGGGWGACFALSPGGSSRAFEMDYTTVCDDDSTSNQPLSYSGGRPLLFDPNAHLYGYTVLANMVQTGFVRKIVLAESNDGEEITVNSIVTWTTGFIAHSVNLEDHFYNWQPRS